MFLCLYIACMSNKFDWNNSIGSKWFIMECLKLSKVTTLK